MTGVFAIGLEREVRVFALGIDGQKTYFKPVLADCPALRGFCLDCVFSVRGLVAVSKVGFDMLANMAVYCSIGETSGTWSVTSLVCLCLFRGPRQDVARPKVQNHESQSRSSGY